MTHNSARLKGQVRCTGNTDPLTDNTFQISKNGGPWLNNGQTLTSQDCNSASNFECADSREGADSWACSDPEPAGTVYDSFTTLAVPLPPPIPCGPTSAPEPVTGLGYTLRYSDCFDTLDRTTWCEKQWWEPNPRAGTQYVQKGVLHLVRRRADGYPSTTMSSEPCGQANPKSYRRGYFEARMKWTGAQAAGPAFWLFSTTHAENGDGGPPDNWPNPACPEPSCLSAELDVFEGSGRYPDVFNGTLHRNSCDCYGEPKRMNSNNWQPQPGMYMPDWHTYAARWTATEVTWYLDGRRIMSAPVYDSTDQPMHLILSHWNTTWEPGTDPNASTPDELHTEVDWVRVWQQ